MTEHGWPVSNQISALEVLSNHVSHIVSSSGQIGHTAHQNSKYFPKTNLADDSFCWPKKTPGSGCSIAPSSWIPMQSQRSMDRRGDGHGRHCGRAALDAAAPALEGGDSTA